MRILVALSFSAVLATACGTSTNGDRAAASSDAGVVDDAPSDASSTTVDGPNLVGDGATVPACPLHCAANLHDVIDCHGATVATCPSDQGCGQGGACVSPCLSAQVNQSTVGCDYYSMPPAESEFAGSCFAAFVANTWDSAVSISVEYNGTTVDATPYAYIPSGSGTSLTYAALPGGQLPPDQIAIVFLNSTDGIACPTGVKVLSTSAVAGLTSTGTFQAFHLSTSAPVVAYDIYPYGGATSYIASATLLFPTSAWDTNYIAVDAFAKSSLSSAQPFIQIAAMTDATHVTICQRSRSWAELVWRQRRRGLRSSTR